jgi:hypothetical protein
MDIKEIGFWAVDWINLVQDGIHMWPLENTVMNLRVP